MGGGFGFGGGQRASNANAPRKGADVRVSVVLGFMEAVHGCTKTITIYQAGHLPGLRRHRRGQGHQPRDLPGLRRPRAM